jgi:hypothetical protein
VSSSSPATCASPLGKTRDSANPKSEWDCIPAVAVRNAFRISSVGVGHSKSFSVRTILTATPRHDTDTSTVHFQTPELDGFVDALARRIASFDQRAVSAAKNLVNQASLPSADRLLDTLISFQTALTWPEAQKRIQILLERGLQREVDFENRWLEALGTLLET